MLTTTEEKPRRKPGTLFTDCNPEGIPPGLFLFYREKSMPLIILSAVSCIVFIDCKTHMMWSLSSLYHSSEGHAFWIEPVNMV